MDYEIKHNDSDYGDNNNNDFNDFNDFNRPTRMANQILNETIVFQFEKISLQTINTETKNAESFRIEKTTLKDFLTDSLLLSVGVDLSSPLFKTKNRATPPITTTDATIIIHGFIANFFTILFKPIYFIFFLIFSN